MANTITATSNGDGTVTLTGVLNSAPSNHESLTDSTLAANTSDGANTSSTDGAGGYCVSAFDSYTAGPGATGKVYRTVSYSNARAVMEVRLSGNSDPAKARVYNSGSGDTSDWLDLTADWQTISLTQLGLSTQWGVEFAPLSPFSYGVTIEIRRWRVRNYLSSSTLEPSIVRTATGQPDTALPFGDPHAVPGYENFLDDQAFTVYDVTAPLQVAHTYSLYIDPGGATAQFLADSDTATIALAGPLVSRPDVVEAALTPYMLTVHRARVTPQQRLVDVIGADAPTLIPAAGARRAGTLGLFATSWADGYALLELLRSGGRVLLRQTDLDGLDMTLAVESAELDRADQSDGVAAPPYVVTVQYRELDPA